VQILKPITTKKFLWFRTSSFVDLVCDLFC